MGLRAGYVVAVALLAGLVTSGLHAQDEGMAWIEAARGAPAGVHSAVPVPLRRPQPPMPVREAQAMAAPDPEPAPVREATENVSPREAPATRLASVTPSPARKPAATIQQAAQPAPPQAVSRPERKPPARTAAREKRQAAPATKEAKCKALGRCRDAFARCKAAFVKKEGAWDLEKQPCGAEYKTCINKSFAPGEMFFTRWFWPYEECP